jgi:hypothetical protein
MGAIDLLISLFAILHQRPTSFLFLSFATSGMYSKLSEGGFMTPGLTLRGNNAYVNSRTMTSPFPNVGAGYRDDFNFYQSQVRISFISGLAAHGNTRNMFNFCSPKIRLKVLCNKYVPQSRSLNNIFSPTLQLLALS